MREGRADGVAEPAVLVARSTEARAVDEDAVPGLVQPEAAVELLEAEEEVGIEGSRGAGGSGTQHQELVPAT